MNTLLLDNYDSFTFNLFQYLAELGGNPVVHRNDKISMDAVAAGGFSHIVIGPGPGNPYTARDIGISRELIGFAGDRRIPMLGVCLGHQILGAVFGADVVRSPEAVHGHASKIHVEEADCPLFQGMNEDFDGMRYHSLCVAESTVTPVLRVTAATAGPERVIMAMEHRTFPLFGVQFHPESVGTPRGKDILKNFLQYQQ